MKEVRIIIDTTMHMIMNVAKTIEEQVVLIHQTMKEQPKTHIPQEDMEDGITQGKMKCEGMINPKFNVIIVTNTIITLFTNNMERQANYIGKKDQEEPTILLAYKGASKEKNT